MPPTLVLPKDLPLALERTSRPSPLGLNLIVFLQPKTFHATASHDEYRRTGQPLPAIAVPLLDFFFIVVFVRIVVVDGFLEVDVLVVWSWFKTAGNDN